MEQDYNIKAIQAGKKNFQKNLVTQTREELRKEEEKAWFADMEKRGLKKKVFGDAADAYLKQNV